MGKLYYTAPPDAQFDELKKKCIEVWKKCNEEYPGYTDEKIRQIKSMGNISDNFMFLVAMLDSIQHIELAEILSDETRKAVRERCLDGGNPPGTYPF